jgi:hypothetical protein
VRIRHIVPAEVGWKAVFKEPDGSESMSRILGWAIADDGSDDTDVFGVVVDPAAPSRIVSAADAVPPAGGEFSRYRFVAPEPLVIPAPATPPPETAAPEDTTEQFAKGLLKRRR